MLHVCLQGSFAKKSRMNDEFLDSLLFILVVSAVGLIIYLFINFSNYKEYAEILIYLISFVGSVLTIYEYLFKKKK